MPGELPVHVNRESLHSIDVQPSFEAHGPFDVRLVNYGESIHVHLHLDDSLSRVAAIDAPNHYVESESARVVRVAVDEDALETTPVRGKIKIASAYGAETRWIDVTISEPAPAESSVQVDESLAQPQSSTDEPAPGLLHRPEVAVLALGFVALLVALGAALVFPEPLLLVSSLVVLGGVLVALFFLSRGEFLA